MNGAEHSAAASDLLNEAWNPPAIHYTPAYLEWQRTFPAPWPLPAATAWDGDLLVGFAGTTARRLQYGSEITWTIVVSFVAVKPDRQRLGIAAALYETLLGAVRNLGAPIVTFAVPRSPGERALRQAYARAGFQIRPFGTYASHMAMPGTAHQPSDWEACSADAGDLLPQIAAYCATDETLAWNSPDAAQIAHYGRDPRNRVFLALRKSAREWCGGAFLIQAELRSSQGLQIVPTLESVFLRRNDAAALPVLLRETLHGSGGMAGRLVAVPNLSAFDQAALQSARIRQVGIGFQGYVCGLRLPFENSMATTLEIV